MRTQRGQAILAKRYAELNQREAGIRLLEDPQLAALERDLNQREASVLEAEAQRVLALADQVREPQVRRLMARTAERKAAQALQLLGEPVELPAPVFERKVYVWQSR